MTQPVSKRDTLHQSFVLGALLLALAGFLGMIADFLVALLLAAVTAGLLHPAQRWLTHLFRGRSGAAAICLLLLALLAIVLPQDAIDRLMEVAQTDSIHIDLETQTVTTPFQDRFAFEIDPFRKHCLINGVDEIGLTLKSSDAISTYETKISASQPWLTPNIA